MVGGKKILLASVLLALVPAPIAAQDAMTANNSTEMNTATDPTMVNGTDPVATDTTMANGSDPMATSPMAADPLTSDPMLDNSMMTPDQEDDDGFPWGILGLLGLAGLLGLKKRDDDHGVR